MAKGTKLSEFEKSEIIALKTVGKISEKFRKPLRRSKTITSNYLKSPNKYGTRKPTCRPEKLLPQFKRRIVREVKKKTSSTSKILRSLVDAPCSTKTIGKHLNNEKLKHKKIIHRPRLTMKRNNLNMLINIEPPALKRGERLFSGTKRNSVLTVQMAFRSTASQKNFQKRITQQGIVEYDRL